MEWLTSTRTLAGRVALRKHERISTRAYRFRLRSMHACIMIGAVTKENVATEGRRKLIAWMRRAHLTQVGLALRLGVAQASVSRWLSGQARPSAYDRETLRAATAIPIDAWDTSEERAKRRSLQKKT